MYTVPFTKVDRMSKKAARTFATLNSTDALTVYRHNKGNFSQVPVRDTLSTYPSAGLKTKAFAVSFHLLLATSGQSYFRLLFSLQEREQYKCYWKDLAHKTQKCLHFYKKIEKRCQNCTQKMLLSTKWKKTQLLIDERLAELGETIVCVISNYSNGSADIHCGVGLKRVSLS